MNTRKKYQQGTNRPVIEKESELALYYNLAVDRMVQVLNYFHQGKVLDDKQWNGKLNQWKGRNDIEPGTSVEFKTLAFLKSFLFLGRESSKSATIVAGAKEQDMIVLFMRRLFDLRNWHSHLYHKDYPLYFNHTSDELMPYVKDFMEAHFEKALETAMGSNEELRSFYHAELKEGFTLFTGDSRLTREGRIFFLQFFLTRSEMNRCISGLEGFKRTDHPKWQLKRKIFSFYSKRDGSSLLSILYKQFELEEGSKATATRQNLQMLNRMNEIIANLQKNLPTLYTNEEIENWKQQLEEESQKPEDERENPEPIRLKNSFFHYGLQYLLDFEDKLKLKEKVRWRFADMLVGEEEQKDKKEEKESIKYVKTKPVFSGRSYAGEKLYISQGIAFFKIEIEGADYTCCINEQSLLYWIAALILEVKKPEDIIRNIQIYVQQYKGLIQELKSGNKVDLQSYSKLYPELLHKKLQTWVADTANTTDDFEAYKNRIKQKIKSGIAELSSITEDKLLEMRQADKNKLLLKWYNYFLSVDNKLSNNKKEVGGFSEIDNLSRFHYVPSNSRGESRKRLIENFTQKMPFYLGSILTDDTYNSIDEIVMAVLPAVKEQFEYWLQIAEQEKHPPEWDNTYQTPIQLLQAEEKQWSKMQEGNWHILARKLNVSNTLMHTTRMGSANIDRVEEMSNFFESQPILLPKYLFVDEAKITATVKPNKQASEEKKSLSKFIREHKLAKGLKQELYNVTDQINYLKELASEEKGKTLGGLISEMLYYKTTDTLLWGICIEYHKKLFSQGMIADNRSLDYANLNVSGMLAYDFEWEIVGKKITVAQKQLKKMMFGFKVKDIETILQNNPHTENNAASIKDVFDNVYFDSIRFIKKVFEFEKYVVGESPNFEPGKSAIQFKPILSKSNISNQERLNDLRRWALHTHIPDGITYTEGIKLIDDYMMRKRK
jgi:hypothetical protein